MLIRMVSETRNVVPCQDLSQQSYVRLVYVSLYIESLPLQSRGANVKALQITTST